MEDSEVEHARQINQEHSLFLSYCRHPECRWQFICDIWSEQAFSAHSGDPDTYPVTCGSCDNCAESTELVDVSDEAAAIVLAVAQTRKTAGAKNIGEVLCQSAAKHVLDVWKNLACYGLLKRHGSNFTIQMVKDLAVHLANRDVGLLQMAYSSGGSKRSDSLTVPTRDRLLEFLNPPASMSDDFTIKAKSDRPQLTVPLRIFFSLGATLEVRDAIREKLGARSNPKHHANGSDESADDDADDNNYAQDDDANEKSNAATKSRNAKQPSRKQPVSAVENITTLDPSKYEQDGALPAESSVRLDDAVLCERVLRDDGVDSSLFAFAIGASLPKPEHPLEMQRTDRLHDELLLSKQEVGGMLVMRSKHSGPVVSLRKGWGEYLSMTHIDHEYVAWCIESGNVDKNECRTINDFLSRGKGLSMRFYCAHAPQCQVKKRITSVGVRGDSVIFHEKHVHGSSAVHVHALGQQRGFPRGQCGTGEGDKCDLTQLRPEWRQVLLSKPVVLSEVTISTSAVNQYLQHNYALSRSHPGAFAGGAGGTLTYSQFTHRSAEAHARNRPWCASPAAQAMLESAETLTRDKPPWQRLLALLTTRVELLRLYHSDRLTREAKEDGTYEAKRSCPHWFEAFAVIKDANTLTVMISDPFWMKLYHEFGPKGAFQMDGTDVGRHSTKPEELNAHYYSLHVDYPFLRADAQKLCKHPVMEVIVINNRNGVNAQELTAGTDSFRRNTTAAVGSDRKMTNVPFKTDDGGAEHGSRQKTWPETRPIAELWHKKKGFGQFIDRETSSKTLTADEGATLKTEVKGFLESSSSLAAHTALDVIHGEWSKHPIWNKRPNDNRTHGLQQRFQVWRRDPGAFCAYGRADVHEKHSGPAEIEGWNARIKDPLDRGGQGIGQQCRLGFDEIIHRLVLFAAACKVRMWEDYKATLRNESQGDAAGTGLVPERSRVPKPRKVKKSPNPTPPTSEDAAMARAMAAGRAPSDLRLDPTTGDALFGVVRIKPRLSFRLPSRHFACVFFRVYLCSQKRHEEREAGTDANKMFHSQSSWSKLYSQTGGGGSVSAESDEKVPESVWGTSASARAQGAATARAQMRPQVAAMTQKARATQLQSQGAASVAAGGQLSSDRELTQLEDVAVGLISRDMDRATNSASGKYKAASVMPEGRRALREGVLYKAHDELLSAWRLVLASIITGTHVAPLRDNQALVMMDRSGDLKSAFLSIIFFMDCADRRYSTSEGIALRCVIAVSDDGDGVPNTKYDGIYLAKADARNTVTGVLLRGFGEDKMMRRSLVAGVCLEESPRADVLAKFLIDGDTRLLPPRGSTEGPTRAEAMEKINEEFPIGKDIFDNDPTDAEPPQWRRILKNHLVVDGKVTIAVSDEIFEDTSMAVNYARKCADWATATLAEKANRPIHGGGDRQQQQMRL